MKHPQVSRPYDGHFTFKVYLLNTSNFGILAIRRFRPAYASGLPYEHRPTYGEMNMTTTGTDRAAALQLAPYIFFYGRCEEALEFYKSVFGGTYEFQRNGD